MHNNERKPGDQTDWGQYTKWGPWTLMDGWRGHSLPVAGMRNYIHYKVWDEITYPFLNFNGYTIEV